MSAASVCSLSIRSQCMQALLVSPVSIPLEYPIPRMDGEAIHPLQRFSGGTGLALPIANSTLQEQQFYLFLETSQATKKTGKKRRTCSEKNATFSSDSSSFGRKSSAASLFTPQPVRLENH